MIPIILLLILKLKYHLNLNNVQTLFTPLLTSVYSKNEKHEH